MCSGRANSLGFPSDNGTNVIPALRVCFGLYLERVSDRTNLQRQKYYF
jgi:hypothetical protein